MGFSFPSNGEVAKQPEFGVLDAKSVKPKLTWHIEKDIAAGISLI
jgi:hypothetical protein